MFNWWRYRRERTDPQLCRLAYKLKMRFTHEQLQQGLNGTNDVLLRLSASEFAYLVGWIETVTNIKDGQANNIVLP